MEQRVLPGQIVSAPGNTAFIINNIPVQKLVYNGNIA